MIKIKISKKIIVSPNKNILYTMNKINEEKHYFLLVVEREKLLGTVSDGDIRRAILKGSELKDKVLTCMNKNPVTASLENKNDFYRLLKSVPSFKKFLPVLDSKKKLKYVLIDEEKNFNKIALIMAGGFGTRFGSKTKFIPKPLLKVSRKPMLELLLEKLEKFDYEKIFISTHYLHRKIEDFINKRKSNSDIKILLEKKPLGTAGSINKLKDINFDILTVINGDIVTDIDLKALNTFHIEKNNDVTVTVAKHRMQIPYGVIKFDDSQNFIAVEEKPDIFNYVLSGIYCLNKEIANSVENKKTDMPNIIERSHKKGKKVGVFPIYEYWMDVGNPKDYRLVNRDRKTKHS